jgi:hypothetical protein
MRDAKVVALVTGLGVLMLGAAVVDTLRDRNHWPPEDLSDLAAGCPMVGTWGAKKFKQAPAHEGKAPHPLVVFVGGGSEPMEGWRPAPDQVQLIACADPQSTKTQRTTCHFDMPTEADVPVYDRPHTVRVTEARTGREVRTVTIQPSIAWTCPNWAELPNVGAELIVEPGAAEYQAALADLVG